MGRSLTRIDETNVFSTEEGWSVDWPIKTLEFFPHIMLTARILVKGLFVLFISS